MANKKEKKVEEQEKKLMEFLYLAKDGKYAPIDEPSFEYVRFEDKSEVEEVYYYNLA